MGFGLGVLALLLIVTVPALFMAGGTTLRGLGWVGGGGGVIVLLIDVTDRITEWVERRRWGRRR